MLEEPPSLCSCCAAAGLEVLEASALSGMAVEASPPEDSVEVRPSSWGCSRTSSRAGSAVVLPGTRLLDGALVSGLGSALGRLGAVWAGAVPGRKGAPEGSPVPEVLRLCLSSGLFP